MAYKYEDKRKHYNRSVTFVGRDGELRITETTDRLFVKVTVADGKGKEMSCFLRNEKWEALHDAKYDIECKDPEEVVVDKLANGAKPKDEVVEDEPA